MSDNRNRNSQEKVRLPWRELRLAGATHILEFDVAPGGAETPMSWDFRLLNAADGSVNTQFAASEAGVEGQNVAP